MIKRFGWRIDEEADGPMSATVNRLRKEVREARAAYREVVGMPQCYLKGKTK